MKFNISVNSGVDWNKMSRDQQIKTNNGLNAMGTAIFNESYAKTPRKGGELRRKRTKKVEDGVVTLTWQSDHAAVQEAGKRRGARPFKNYTTPGTGKKFAENAAKTVGANYRRYF